MAEGEGNGVEGGEGGGEKKKVMKFSFSKTKPSNRRPPLAPKGKEKEAVVVEYVTSVDLEAGIVVSNPRAGSGLKVVPKLENSWRPEKRMKNIMMEGDAMKPTEETFEMETMDAGPKPNVQYGLTLMEPVETNGDGGGEAPRRMSLKELEDQKLREDLSNLPEEATLDRYEELPVEEFGEALLRGMGWEKGKPIGRNAKTVVLPLEYTRRQGKLGLGATPPPPKETNKKYIKPGETREKSREAYVKPRDFRERRGDEESRENGREEHIRSEKSRENREEYVRPSDSREYRREDDSRGSTRDDYVKPRDSRENRRKEESRGSRREDYSESREEREERREKRKEGKDSRESRRDEYSEPKDSRERREDYRKRDEHRESRREQKRRDRR